MISGIWAVARTVLREIARMRFLVAFVALYILAVTFGFAYWVHTGAGPAHEKIQTFLGYSLRFTSWFFSLLTIFIAIATVARDIQRREIFTIATKPISRAQFLLGKLLGMALFNLIILAIVGGSVYALARVMQQTEPTTPYEESRIADLVLAARAGVKPHLPDVSDEAARMTEEHIRGLINSGELTEPAQIRQARARYYRDSVQALLMRANAVGPGRSKVFQFSGIRPRDPDGYVYIRYKQEVSVNPPNNSLWNEWFYSSDDPQRAGVRPVYVEPDRALNIRTVHEFPVPARAVSPDGRLYITYRNHPVNSAEGEVVVIYPPDTGIEALYVAGPFETNFLRTLGLIYCRLLFLSIAGVAAGAWLSLPVAVLLVLAIYFLGLSSEFILEAVDYTMGQTGAELLRAFMFLMPNLAAYDPTNAIETGRLVENATLLSAVGVLLLVKGGIIGVIGYLIFRYRELARVIV